MVSLVWALVFTWISCVKIPTACELCEFRILHVCKQQAWTCCFWWQFSLSWWGVESSSVQPHCTETAFQESWLYAGLGGAGFIPTLCMVHSETKLLAPLWMLSPNPAHKLINLTLCSSFMSGSLRFSFLFSSARCSFLWFLFSISVSLYWSEALCSDALVS